ncbi:PTPA-domain-containing protein [Wolfiporia cocos MD-104 SS10]|uniref:Serine/threonine-protein phosphatase 2A activator n=1 Tax=Wolfiporia cocos (strain MD-104) TaxID=742152 RepID=A0A2H3JMF9_WOLCO|nr:PTPA-domain-containing protein [Wolfiporia cocos MD-104 SS10]
MSTGRRDAISAPAVELPPLRQVFIQDLPADNTPATRIRTDEDLEAWKDTRGYQDYGLFIRRLTESVVGYFLPWTNPICQVGTFTQSMIALLDTLDGWIDEIPPLPTPQRFGNLAFRSWGKRLENEADAILSAMLPDSLRAAVPFLAPYLLTSFGSFTRMDYGTGHEASFALLLLCLTLIRFFTPEAPRERELVLCVFVRYMRLCWRLQDVYKLEPAGSHGVWGLDDYSFLGYIFGSGQLRDQSDIPVAAVLHPPLPETNLYFMLIMRIHEVKHGPFHEHSSQLYSIAAGVVTWAKVNSGLIKMYEAEVLGKRVVVQHLPLGGLIEWDARPDAYRVENTEKPTVPQASSHDPLGGVMRAPWSSAAVGAGAQIGRTQAPVPLPTVATQSRRSGPPGPQYDQSSRGRQTLGPPIIPARAPLGPTASTSLQPTRSPKPPSHNLPPRRV